MAIVKIGNAPDLLVGTGANGALEAKRAEDVRAAIGVAPALQTDVTIYVSPTGSDVEGDGSQEAPYATIQRAVDSVPKYLNAHTAAINIADGEYDEAVIILGFTAGTLALGGRTVSSAIIRNIAVLNSRIVIIKNCTLKNIGATEIQPHALLYVNEDSCAVLGNVTIDCGATNCHGMYVSNSKVITSGAATLTINNVDFVNGRCAFGTYGAHISLFKIAGVNATDKTVWGICSEYGSIVAYQENALTANTAYRTVYGGRIYGGGQTSIPNY